ncbi:hypothetical protein BV22DRAFT_587434 [Leucogyrophana mollusca]|uniref:Uncharacterized protein n=1 Tax=Leucogyrophana mollusca TaxID=85980 RepID=A0ACB8BDP5_9AGAM|nr:hypothetical protein BV22DRAFT_587434 [Leucogyrophana mollusca]
MPEPYSELANWDGRLFQSPKRDQNIPSSSIGSPSRSVSYPQPVYTSSSQLTYHRNTEKLSPAQEFVDNKRADLVQNSVLSEHGLSAEMLSTPRSHKLSDVPPVSATVVTPGADNSSKPKHGMSLSSLIEKAVGHKLGEKFIFSERQITHAKVLPSEHARNPSSPVIGTDYVDKPSNIKPLYMPHSQLPANKDQGRPSENTEHTCDAVSAREAPISATADLSFPSNIIPAVPSGFLDEVRPIGASLTPSLSETAVTPLFLPDSPTSSSTPTPKGRGGDEDEENFVNDMLVSGSICLCASFTAVSTRST